MYPVGRGICSVSSPLRVNMGETPPPPKTTDEGVEDFHRVQEHETSVEAGPRPEVPSTPKRRRFSAAYKLAILRELDSCSESGAIGAVLRREGLYSSHIVDWRRKRAAGELQALSPKKRGRPRKPRRPLQSEVERLKRDKARLEEELRKARLIIEVQKKVSAMLDNPNAEPAGSSD